MLLISQQLKGFKHRTNRRVKGRKEKRKRDSRFMLWLGPESNGDHLLYIRTGNLAMECRREPPATKPYLSFLIPHCVRDFLVGIETGHIFLGAQYIPPDLGFIKLVARIRT
jgi:hypothetical protein